MLQAFDISPFEAARANRQHTRLKRLLKVSTLAEGLLGAGAGEGPGPFLSVSTSKSLSSSSATDGEPELGGTAETVLEAAFFACNSSSWSKMSAARFSSPLARNSALSTSARLFSEPIIATRRSTASGAAEPIMSTGQFLS
jgi:hypothetical protein